MARIVLSPMGSLLVTPLGSPTLLAPGCFTAGS
jgi:hypothetical protein